MKAYIGLGSNSGDRLHFLREAIHHIGLIPQTQVLRLASIYETEPIDCEGEWFYNTVLEVDSSLDHLYLLHKLLNIQSLLGRVRVGKGLARTIDLDLLLYGQNAIDDGIATLPHPRMHERRFVLEPLCELNEDFVHPVLGRTVGDLLKGLTGEYLVKKVIPIKEASLAVR